MVAVAQGRGCRGGIHTPSLISARCSAVAALRSSSLSAALRRCCDTIASSPRPVPRAGGRVLASGGVVDAVASFEQAPG